MSFYIYNQIYSDTAAMVSANVEQIDEIEINSQGGDVFAAIAIHDTLKTAKKEIPVRVKGLCASAATLILCGAKKVVAAENSLFMIHSPSVMLMDRYDAAQLEAMHMTMEKLTAQVKTIYSARLKDVDLSQERWLTAEEALAAGLIDEIDGRVEVTASGGLMFVNKCVFKMEKPPDKQSVAAEVLAMIRDQIASGAGGVNGSTPPPDEATRKFNMLLNLANGGI